MQENVDTATSHYILGGVHYALCTVHFELCTVHCKTVHSALKHNAMQPLHFIAFLFDYYICLLLGTAGYIVHHSMLYVSSNVVYGANGGKKYADRGSKSC